MVKQKQVEEKQPARRTKHKLLKGHKHGGIWRVTGAEVNLNEKQERRLREQGKIT